MKSKNINVFHPLPHPIFLKVSKFLVKISQFEFLVITEQSIPIYKLFWSLNIPDFSLFFAETLQHP